MEKWRQPDDWGHVKGPFSVEHTQCSSASLSLPFPFFPKNMRTKVAKKGAYRQNLQGLCRLYFPLNGSCHLDIPYTLDGGCHEKYAKNILVFDLWLWSLLSLSECIDLNYIPKSLGDTKILSCIEFTFKFFTQQGQVITFMILEVEDYQLFLYWAEKMIF